MSVLSRLKERRVAIPLATFLAVAVIASIAGYVFGNWLAAVILGLAVALVVLVGMLLRTLLAQEREEQLDWGLGGTADQTPAGQQTEQRAGRFQDRFKQALADLKRSRLSGEELPWLLVVGPRGAGKSAMLGGSGLELPAEFAHVARGGATQDCDWWFTNRAIVLDTAGRYLDSEDAEDRAEWRRLLRMVRKARPAGPVNGLIVALPASSLIGGHNSELDEAARLLRRRINEITQELRVDLPIYVVVTKADQIEGFVEVVTSLPPPRLSEIFGWTNRQRLFADAGDLTTRGFEEVRDRLETLVPELVMRETDAQRQRRLQLFAHEFEALAAAVAGFVRVAFAPSRYEETPFFRGVYLTSARREGETVSPVLQRLGLEASRTRFTGSESSGGMFLRDLFSDAIIGDQNLALPMSSLGPRMRSVFTWTGAAAAATAVVVWGLAAWPIYSQLSAISQNADTLLASAVDIEAVDRLRVGLVEAGARTPLETLGLGGPLDHGVDRGRRTFVWAFEREFEEPAKASLVSAVRQYDAAAFEALAEVSLDLAWLNAGTELSDTMRPNLYRYARLPDNETDLQAFTAGYDSFVRWAPQLDIEDRIRRERDVLSGAAGTLLQLAFLERWARENPRRVPAVHYQDLGLPAPPTGVRDAVPGAYTEQAWNILVRALLEGVSQTQATSDREIGRFRRAFTTNYDAEWKRFLLDTPLTRRADPDVKGSPYVKLLHRVDTEMQVEIPREADGPWILALREVLRSEPLPVLEEEKDEDEEDGDAAEEEPAPPWERYLTVLETVAADVDTQVSPPDALEVALEVARVPASSFHSALDEIKAIVPRTGTGGVSRKLREILEMPVLNGLDAVLQAAAREIDVRWQERIVAPYSGPLSQTMLADLYGVGGALDVFSEENLAPFYTSDGRSKEVLEERQVPLGPRFLTWVKKGKRVRDTLAGAGAEIPVKVEGVPSKVMSGNVLVTRRDLRVTCAAGSDVFRYSEGYGRHTFSWNSSCDEVILRIWASRDGVQRELLPAQRWEGPLALPNFFNSGTRSGRDEYRWTFRYPDVGVDLSVGYRMAGKIIEVAHSSPPRSVRE